MLTEQSRRRAVFYHSITVAPHQAWHHGSVLLVATATIVRGVRVVTIATRRGLLGAEIIDNSNSWSRSRMGSKDNEERGERCKAQCGDCLAEWTYDF